MVVRRVEATMRSLVFVPCATLPRKRERRTEVKRKSRVQIDLQLDFSLNQPSHRIVLEILVRRLFLAGTCARVQCAPFRLRLLFFRTRDPLFHWGRVGLWGRGKG
jgi:hypothetical protein